MEWGHVIERYETVNNRIQQFRQERKERAIPVATVLDPEMEFSPHNSNYTVPGVYYATDAGERKIYYLREPGVSLLSAPQFFTAGIPPFLTGFDPDLEFSLGLSDYMGLGTAVDPRRNHALAQFAGQVCYASFDKNRTQLSDGDRYVKNILESGHGSVVQHMNYSLLFYGISRSCTHEFVRHGTGTAFSQASQRYIDGKKLRFVERAEIAEDGLLHARFEQQIRDWTNDYEYTANILMEKQLAGDKTLSGEQKRDLRKKVNQSARHLLPNATEAPTVVTANVRAWRNILEQRCSPHAETEIRTMGIYAYRTLFANAPLFFLDYRLIELNDGSLALETDNRKV